MGEKGIVEKYECACCGQKTLLERPPGTYQICVQCGWEDDKAQLLDPNYAGGANTISLNEARAHWLTTQENKE